MKSFITGVSIVALMAAVSIISSSPTLAQDPPTSQPSSQPTSQPTTRPSKPPIVVPPMGPRIVPGHKWGQHPPITEVDPKLNPPKKEKKKKKKRRRGGGNH